MSKYKQIKEIWDGADSVVRKRSVRAVGKERELIKS